MTLPQKSALSLLISIIPFVIVAILAYTGLFNLVETRFYNPSVANSLSRETERDAGVIQDFFAGLLENFSVDLDGTLCYETLEITVYDTQNRIIFSFSADDSTNLYQRAELFSISTKNLAGQLISAGRLKIGEDISLTSTPPGIIAGGPAAHRAEIINSVSSIWGNNYFGIRTFGLPYSDLSFTLISAKTSQGILYGRVVNSEIFMFPRAMELILLISVFLTIYLTVFLLLNCKQDPELVMRSRIKTLQKVLIEQFLDNKTDVDWVRWTKELEQRGDDIKNEIKLDITGKNDSSDKKSLALNSLVDKSWDELLTIIGSSAKSGSEIDEEKLKKILSSILPKPDIAFSVQNIHNVNEVQESASIPEDGLPEEPGEIKEEEPALLSEKELAEELKEIDEIDEEEPVSLPIPALEEEILTSPPEPEQDFLEENSSDTSDYSLQESAEEPLAEAPLTIDITKEIEPSPVEDDEPVETETIAVQPETISPFEFIEDDDDSESEPPPQKGLMARCIEARKTIKEQNGIHIVNSSFLEPDNEPDEELNTDFKLLVESVLKNR